MMVRTFQKDVIYAIIPGATEHTNDSKILYKLYLSWFRKFVDKSFLQFCREYRLSGDKNQAVLRNTAVGSRGRQSGMKCAIALRYSFEQKDNFIGEFCSMNLPHFSDAQFTGATQVVQFTKHFLSAQHFLCGLRWQWDDSRFLIVSAADPSRFLDPAAFPLAMKLSAPSSCNGHLVFSDELIAMGALGDAIYDDLTIRVHPGRAASFMLRYSAIRDFYQHIQDHDTIAFGEDLDTEKVIAMWNLPIVRTLEPRVWSPKQQEVKDAIRDGLAVSDTHAHSEHTRFLYVSGKPGSGKSEVLIYAAIEAASSGACVLIMCPTGTLVHSYRDRMGSVGNIVIETIHSACQITRAADAMVNYAPPGRLRKFDLILVDECSQIQDAVARLLYLGFKELPQRPYVGFVADFQQLRPMQSRATSLMQGWCGATDMPVVELDVIFRTKDPALLQFLQLCREVQPTRQCLYSFFHGRLWRRTATLSRAVGTGLALGRQFGTTFTWLTVTNPGAMEVSKAALEHEHVTDVDLCRFSGDLKLKFDDRLYLKTGIYIRLTRNLDKDRGFVNGAIGQILHPFRRNGMLTGVFTMKLTNGTRLLVHPISDGGVQFLPCTYGYATTIRRAQGSSLDMGCLYFDHCFPPERGYAYVGASRFKTREHLFHYGTIRRSDWLPVGAGTDAEIITRGSVESANSDSEEDQADESECGGSSGDEMDRDVEFADRESNYDGCQQSDEDEDPDHFSNLRGDHGPDLTSALFADL
jgi:hypothetical protein